VAPWAVPYTLGCVDSDVFRYLPTKPVRSPDFRMRPPWTGPCAPARPRPPQPGSGLRPARSPPARSPPVRPPPARSRPGRLPPARLPPVRSPPARPPPARPPPAQLCHSGPKPVPLRPAQQRAAELRGPRLRAAGMRPARIPAAAFRPARIPAARLQPARLQPARLQHARLQPARLQPARLPTAEPRRAAPTRTGLRIRPDGDHRPRTHLVAASRTLRHPSDANARHADGPIPTPDDARDHGGTCRPRWNDVEMRADRALRPTEP
jgi:hypothetical protein